MNDAEERFDDVTVIIPAFRAASTIGRALASVAVQTVKPRCVVVVDDGSPDDTFAATQAWSSRMNGIELVVIQQANSGAGAARNRALAEARTEYVAFLDADDEWFDTKLARSLEYLKSGDYVLVGHDSEEIEGSQITRLECARRFRASAHSPFAGLYRSGFLDTTTVVARLDRVRAAGGFDESLPNAQDFDLWLAMLAPPSARFFVFDEVLSRYYRMPGSIMTHVKRRLQCSLIIAKRHAPALKWHPGSPTASLCFRILAIHWEAISAFIAKGERGAAVRTLVVCPFTLVATLSTYFLAARGGRAGPTT